MGSFAVTDYQGDEEPSIDCGSKYEMKNPLFITLGHIAYCQRSY